LISRTRPASRSARSTASTRANGRCTSILTSASTACEPVCPVEAIYYEDDVPEQWADYYKANVEFFDDLGSPGGAAKMGLIPKDHAIIEALPPQEHAE